MKFLGEILRRKAPAPLATVPTVQEEQIEVQGELEVLQIEISMRQAQLDQLQQESAQLGLQLGEVAALRAQLLIRLSEGSSSASASIDTLDSETLALQRARDGLGLRMQDLERWIGLKQRRASELAHLRDDIRQDAAVAELAAQAESTTEEILASWRHSCELSFNLMNALDEALTANLDPEHKHKVLAISLRVATAMQRASLAFVNENWQFARADSFHNLTIRPGRPRARAAAVEKVG